MSSTTDTDTINTQVSAQNAEAATANPTQPPVGAQAATGDTAGTIPTVAATTSAVGAPSEGDTGAGEGSTSSPVAASVESPASVAGSIESVSEEAKKVAENEGHSAAHELLDVVHAFFAKIDKDIDAEIAAIRAKI